MIFDYGERNAPEHGSRARKRRRKYYGALSLAHGRKQIYDPFGERAAGVFEAYALGGIAGREIFERNAAEVIGRHPVYGHYIGCRRVFAFAPLCLADDKVARAHLEAVYERRLHEHVGSRRYLHIAGAHEPILVLVFENARAEKFVIAAVGRSHGQAGWRKFVFGFGERKSRIVAAAALDVGKERLVVVFRLGRSAAVIVDYGVGAVGGYCQNVGNELLLLFICRTVHPHCSAELTKGMYAAHIEFFSKLV